MTDNWTPPAPRDLLEQVRDIIRDNPERHNQSAWVSNAIGSISEVQVDKARQYALAPVPEVPENPMEPYCGTTGCVAGWAAIVGSQPGSYLSDGYYITDPAGSRESISSFAERSLGLSYGQAAWLFDGNRTGDEVLDGLNALLEDPETDLRHLHDVTVTVKVLDADGNEVHSREVKVDRNASEYAILVAARNEI